MDFSHFIEVMGLLGVLCYVGSYALLQIGVVRGSGYSYALMNLGGALFVAISLINNWNPWSALVSLAFTVFSLIGIARKYLNSRALRFNADERALMRDRFATMMPGQMRRVLDQGTWRAVGAGTELTQEGAPVTRLVYLVEGEVDVFVGGQKIAQVGAGEFIGEMGSLSREPASATVVTNQKTRFFELSSDKLARLTRTSPEMLAQFEFAFAWNIRSKLKTTNALLEQALRERQDAPKQDKT